MTFFARLDGDMVGIDHYCRFEADSAEKAQEIADGYAEENYSQYDDPYDENDSPNFGATIEVWDAERHGEYIGDPCFDDHVSQ